MTTLIHQPRKSISVGRFGVTVTRKHKGDWEGCSAQQKFVQVSTTKGNARQLKKRGG